MSRRRRLAQAAVAAALATSVAACAGSDPSPSAEQPEGCEALLEGRGFGGYFLASEEAGPRPGTRYCVFVLEKHREALLGAQVPARRVLYEPGEEVLSERPVSVPATGSFAGAPRAS